jgi:hypothetical protein
MTGAAEISLRQCCGKCKWCGDNDYPHGAAHVHVCKLTESNQCFPKYALSKAVAKDGESWYAILLVALDFCCNQFEAKDA